MTSTMHERIEQRIAMWDTNGDGNLDRSDFETEGKRIVQSFGEPENSPKGHAVISAYSARWNALADAAGVGSDRSVTCEQAVDVTEQVLAKGAGGFAALARPTVRAIVDLCDSDGDGKVSRAEFGRWMDACGVDESAAQESFNKIDS